MTATILLYAQYLLGIGHLQRILRIGEALARDGAAVTLVSGGPPVPILAATPLRVVQLPPVRARDASFTLVGATGEPVDAALWAARRAVLLDTFAALRPDAVVLEGYPFARRAFHVELEPLIAAVRAARPRPRLLCSIRDILVARDDPARDRAVVATLRAAFDAVLVHGDPRFITLAASFAAAGEIAGSLIYTGYVTAAAPAPAAGDSAAGAVLVSAGGGAAGQALLAAAVAARRGGCLAELPWRLLSGPNLPAAEFAALAADLPDGVVLERYRPDLDRMIRDCRVSVSQAGYNTVLDIVAARVPAVLVPFAAASETEQTVRAEALAARGVAAIVPGETLSPERLAAALVRAAGRPPAALTIATDGARRAARIIVALIRGDLASAAAGGII